MSHTATYPVFLSLAGKNCVVAGFGSVGKRKVRGLLAARPHSIQIFDPFINFANDREAAELAGRPGVAFLQRVCEERDLDDIFMVFAATCSRDENRRLAEMCRRGNILCNNATEPDSGSFILPAVAENRNLRVALSTGGASPFLARRWKKELVEWLERKTSLAWLMGALRPLVLQTDSNDGRHPDIFKKIADSPLDGMLAAGEHELFLQWFSQNIPQIPETELKKILEEHDHVFPG